MSKNSKSFLMKVLLVLGIIIFLFVTKSMQEILSIYILGSICGAILQMFMIIAIEVGRRARGEKISLIAIGLFSSMWIFIAAFTSWIAVYSLLTYYTDDKFKNFKRAIK